MEANELRIGNYVDCTKKRHNEKVILVESVTFDKINVNFREYDLSDLLPISLTEEIILKCGFKTRVTINHSVQYFIGENPITHDWLFDILWLDGYSAPFYRNGFHKIEYLHQLQNLYFALTGEELTVNL